MRALGFGVRSDWPDLNDLCNSAHIQLSWSDANEAGRVVAASDGVVTDASISVRAVLSTGDTTKVLDPINCRRDSIEHQQARQRQNAGLICAYRGNWPACPAPTTRFPIQFK